jgi:hypothetical protein
MSLLKNAFIYILTSLQRTPTREIKKKHPFFQFYVSQFFVGNDRINFVHAVVDYKKDRRKICLDILLVKRPLSFCDKN